MKAASMNRQRRALLKAAQGTGLLAVAAALFGGRQAPAPAIPVDEVQAGDGSKRGYHETDHIRKYYAKARYF